MRALLIICTALLATACGTSDPSDTPHSVDEYMANAELTSRTLDACRAANSAEARIMRDKEACQNVREAERRIAAEETAAATADFNARMRAELDKKRRERETARSSGSSN